ncbi:MAG: hypothetical protein ORN98_03370 [Alphaproteobacteria bacterium]|nr:hypothetical protein [Alphaproteobacteria bacterium]
MNKNDGEKSPHVISPKMRLFMSVDLIGSTAEKQTGGMLPLDAKTERDTESKFKWQDATYPKWHGPIFNFFSVFEDCMNQALNRYELFCRSEKFENYLHVSEQPKIWKRNGDEIIYTVLLQDAVHVMQSIALFLSALNAYRGMSGFTEDTGKNTNENANQPSKKRLNAKATIWLAGFPIVNSEFALQKSPDRVSERKLIWPTNANLYDVDASDGEQSLDYIGPSMDIGFRLTKLADYQRVPISFEVAYILAKLGTEFSNNKSSHRPKIEKINDWRGREKLYADTNFFHNLFYDGLAHLPGVFGGQGYPHFWLRSPYQQIDGMQADLINKHACDLTTATTYCDTTFAEKNHFLLKPYFANCPLFDKPQPQYNQVLSYWIHLYKKQKGMDDGLEGDRNEFSGDDRRNDPNKGADDAGQIEL